MLTITFLTTLLTSTALALPSTLHPRQAGDELCTPTSYTITSYKLNTSATEAYVGFDIESAFPQPDHVTDPVIGGTMCEATGDSIPNSNECFVAGRRLLFDLRGPQEQAYYQITHTWGCNG